MQYAPTEGPMPTPLHVLILEDSPSDVELMLHELRRAGFAPRWQHVATEPDFLAGLALPPDIILADYALPQFDALRALRCVQEHAPDIPVIVVTGALSDEAAVACLQQGAADYLLKDRLGRLGEAVRHALAERDLRAQHRRAHEELRASEERFRALSEQASEQVAEARARLDSARDITERKRAEAERAVLLAREQAARQVAAAHAQVAAIVEASEDAIFGWALDGTITSWNPAAARLYGYSVEEAVGQPVTLLFPPDHRDELPELLGRVARGESIPQFETERQRKGGTRVAVPV